MRLVSLLSWHDEDDDLLRSAITSAAEVGSDVLVSVPGPYRHYPRHGGPSVESAAVVEETARECGMTLVDVRYRVYVGDEVAKRAAMLHAALAISSPADWLLVIDADHHVRVCSDVDLLSVLGDAKHHVGQVRFVEHFDEYGQPVELAFKHVARPLLRARPDLRIGSNHYTYVTSAGQSTYLGDGTTLSVVDLYDDVVVEHRRHLRAPEKIAAQTAYYEIRDGEGLESRS